MSTNNSIIFAEELANELDKIPEQYWSKLLQIICLFRESVTPVSEIHSQAPAIVEAIEDLGLVHALTFPVKYEIEQEASLGKVHVN